MQSLPNITKTSSDNRADTLIEAKNKPKIERSLKDEINEADAVAHVRNSVEAYLQKTAEILPVESDYSADESSFHAIDPSLFRGADLLAEVSEKAQNSIHKDLYREFFYTCSQNNDVSASLRSICVNEYVLLSQQSKQQLQNYLAGLPNLVARLYLSGF